MDMRKLVGLNVLRLRRERGISQEELSFRSGFGRAYLSGLETGKRNPTIVSLWEIASALDATPIDLLQQLSPADPARAEPKQFGRTARRKPTKRQAMRLARPTPKG